MASTSHSEPEHKSGKDRIASPVRLDPNSQTGGEQWYFRIDGKNFGPSSRVQLEHFLRPPRLCKTLEVMCQERDGYWLTIGPDETIDIVLQRFGIPVPSVPATATINKSRTHVIPRSSSKFTAPNWISTPIDRLKEGLSDLAGRLGPPVKKFGPYFIIALALLMVSATAFVMTGGLRMSEKQIVSQFDTIWKEAMSMNQSAAPDQWRQFADKSLTELEPTLRDLSQSSSVKNSSRQQLLFAGRDHLRKMLKADKPPQKFSVSARVFEKYMQLAHKNLRG